MALVLALVLQAGLAQTGTALVCTDPVLLEIGEGQVETLQIVLVNAKNIYGIDLQAAFDPTVVQVVDADPKQKGIQMTSGVFLKPDYAVRNIADNKTGMLRYVITQVKPTLPANGKGIVLSIQFRGKVADTSTKLTIKSAVIADLRGNKPAVTTQDADLVIVPKKLSTSTHLPTQTRISATPTVPAIAFIQTRSRSPVRLSVTPTQHKSVGEAERQSGLSDQVPTYISICGFAGAILFSGLSVWLLMAKHHKERDEKEK
jgi:hypothetical protein